MPALLTHKFFGDRVLAELPEGLVGSEAERMAFTLGCQGPDPLFFRWRALPAEIKASSRLGSAAHASNMSAALEALRDGVGHLPQSEAALGRAFVLGWLCHYTLDRNAHPFIYSMQFAAIEANPELTGAGSEVHAVIESDLDSWLLWREHQFEPADFPICDVVASAPQVLRVVGALVANMAAVAYHSFIAPATFAEAIRDMHALYAAAEPYGSAPSRAIGAIERKIRAHSLVQSLTHRSLANHATSWANEQHEAWENPFTHETSTESFAELMDRAARDYAQVAHDFISGVPCSEITRHIDFSGQPLEATEERKGRF